MRVALLSHNAQAGDAIGNQVAEKLAFFLDRGADVNTFIESGANLHPAVRGHCRVLPAGRPDADAWTFLADCDLVVAEYGQYYPLLDLLPALAGGKPRLLLDYHGVTPPELWGLQNREALDRGVRQRGLVWCTDAALVHSAYTLRELREQCGFPADRLHRLGFPVDLDAFRPGPGGAWRQTLGLGEATLLLFVGRLAPNKRVPLLVEALARLRDVRPAIHALVVGNAGDVYRTEAGRCRQLAAELGVADRLHFLGHLTGQPLRDAYRAADVFVMPSRWESFCIPAVEAMACGVPVVAARTTALPETVAGAGLTFQPDDADDLERQLRRVLQNPGGATPGLEEAPVTRARVAVVSFRYGADLAGGAETSLRTIARALAGAGCAVEVFTTCVRDEATWTDELAEGTTQRDGLPVHRFRIDAHDRPRHLEAVRAILQADGPVSAATEQEYLRHSVHSAPLLEALRRGGFDAILTGPYLYGLTADVASTFPEKTLLLPCFHDEPFARLRAWQTLYDRVGGVLFHSEEERRFAETELGLNNPGAVRVGTCIDTETAGDAEAGRRASGASRYVVYAGRYSLSKDLPTLLEHARRYHERRPGRFTFVFLGQGPVAIPAEPWARDLGFVDEGRKRDVLAGAAALVQPSRHESLSLVALEAWAQGTPVLAGRHCAVLAGHLARGGGGRAIDGYEEFEQALDDLWARPEAWREMGRRGGEYVRAEYGSPAALTERLLGAVADLRVPVAERMRRRGLERAASFGRPAWRAQFAQVVEGLLDVGPRPYREQVEVAPRGGARAVSAGTGAVLVPVRVVNRGTHALVAEGPARTVLCCRVVDEEGRPAACGAEPTPLPGLLQPGRALAAAVPVPVPLEPGTYRIAFWAERADREAGDATPPAEHALCLVVTGAETPAEGAGCCAPALEATQAALVEADRLRQLPDDYTDVTEGLLASLKRRIKRKLLGNFKHAYVDVLSRQQSAFNRRLLDAVGELAECCATLDHAVRVLLRRVAELEGRRRGRGRRRRKARAAADGLAGTQTREG